MLEKLTACPGDVVSAQHYSPYAEARLAPAIWQYLEEGSGDGQTLRDNLDAFARIPLTPRPLTNVRGGRTRLELFGQTLEHPVLLAPVAYQRLFHSDGECGSAAAAAALGGQFIASSLASQTLEDIGTAGGQPLWFQLYWQGSRERTLKLLRRAEAAGYAVVVFTVDAPVKQAGMVLPNGIAAVNLDAPAAIPALAQGQSAVFDGWMAQAPNWDDLAWLRDQTRLPLLVKGVLHPDDACRAAELGCDGVVVSNHGGRVLDGVTPAIDALPRVVAELNGKVPVLLDSGVRSGRDVYKALMLGASAVLLGRPYIWGLSAVGALGVAHVIRLVRDELEMTMALSGARTLQEIPVSV
jgi:4-hydroxymandelate oxidase